MSFTFTTRFADFTGRVLRRAKSRRCGCSNLHNYRLLCPGAMFLRDGAVCESCLGKMPIPAVIHKCYRGSRAASAATAAMLVSHRVLRTYRKRVDAYVALTEFGKQKFIAGGLPADRIHVKPNFVSPDPGIGTGAGGYAVFVGRLAPGKGLGNARRSLEESRAAHTVEGPRRRPARRRGGKTAPASNGSAAGRSRKCMTRSETLRCS